jgi:branched-chain amino acid transport system permease protein
VLATTAGLVLVLMPLVLPAYPLFTLSHMLVFAIACMGVNLLHGTAGSLSFGHATYFGVAAYTGAFLYRFTSVTSFEAYLASGIFSATLFALVIGFLCARSTEIFFTMLTLSFSMVVHALVIDGAVFQLMGGVGWALYLLGEGSMYIPRLTILGAEIPAADFIVVFYRIIALAFLVSTLVLWRIGASPFGQALRAIRDNEMRAASIGIPVWQYRWRAFILSGAFVGLAGGLYGQLMRQITPEQLHWLFSAKLILAVVLGGSRHFLGPALGAFVFTRHDRRLRGARRWSPRGSDDDLDERPPGRLPKSRFTRTPTRTVVGASPSVGVLAQTCSPSAEQAADARPGNPVDHVEAQRAHGDQDHAEGGRLALRSGDVEGEDAERHHLPAAQREEDGGRGLLDRGQE